MEILLSADPGPLRLRLELPRGGGAYRVVLQTAEGREVWRARDLTPERRGDASALFVEVPRSVVAEGDYVLSLEAPGGDSEADVAYFFRIPRP
jgi:hypothetical protein